jgi:uncharacterized protein (TIGR02284 family)
MESNKATIETLNDLVQINNDRILGYENALKEVEDGDELKSIFLEKIDESRRLKLTLVTEVEVLGSNAETGTSVSGKIHRTWLDVKAAFSGHNDKSVLEECEFGEDAIKKAYKSALAEEHLPAYIRDILNDQLSILITSHDEIKALRDNA